MRSKLLAIVVGCGLALSAAAAIACEYNVTASNAATSQQSAQAEQQSQDNSN